MTTLIDIFARDITWRRQLKEIDRLRSTLRKLNDLGSSIDDEIVIKRLSVIAWDVHIRLGRAKLALQASEERILRSYYRIVNSPCDYSTHYDDEYFIERIDLDGYLRGTIL